MQEKRHDRVVEMRLCFFLGKVGDYNVSFVETRMCRSTDNYNLENMLYSYFFNEKALEYWKNIFSSDTCEKLSDQDIYKLLNWR